MPEGAPRFILIDHSIRGQGGHYLEYAERVLAAADAAGLRPVLATNREFQSSAELGYPAHPVYENGVFLRSARNSAKASLYRFARRTGIAWALRGVSTRLKAAREEASSSAGSETTGALDRQAASFAEDTRTLLNDIAPGLRDLIFVPTLIASELLAIAKLLEESKEARLPSWHLLFRRNVYHGYEPRYEGQWTPESTRMRTGFDALRRPLRSGARVFCYTDTDELCRQFEHLVAGPGSDPIEFQRVAIPVDVSTPSEGAPAGATPAMQTEERPLELVYVGDARGEKGFERLPAIVENTRDLPVHFTIQFYLPELGHEPWIQRARAALARSEDRVTLIERSLSSADYRDLLLSADIVLIPYDHTLYYARSSGIFAEALVSGVPTIVPGRTWMHSHISADDQVAHEELLKSSASIPRGAWDDVRIAVEEVREFSIRTDASSTHLLVRFEQPGYGEFVTVTLGETGGEPCGSQIAGGRPGTSSILFALPRTSSSEAELCLRFSIPEGCSGTCLKTVKCDSLSSRDPIPLGSGGRSFDDPADIPGCLRELTTHYDAYRDHCRNSADRWARYHNPRSIVRSLCERAKV